MLDVARDMPSVTALVATTGINADDQGSGWLPADSAEQREVVQQVLGPLIDYDRTHGSHLVRAVVGGMACA